MRPKLSPDEIKRIADRAERRASGKDRGDLRTFICESCNHEIIVSPLMPEDFIPTLCKQCQEEQQHKKGMDTQKKFMELGVQILSIPGMLDVVIESMKKDLEKPKDDK